MIDDNINPSTINLRSKGLSNGSGKLHKGCVKDATTKLSIGSIPSTYESIIYKTESKKAFGTSQKRFYEKKTTDATQVYSEDISTIQSFPNQSKVNHNRLGQNCFISKQKRQWIRCIKTPGPTHYYPSESKEYENRPRKCFTRESRQKYRRQVLLEKKQQDLSPGPGQYIYDTEKFWNTSYKGWRSSFETKVNRDGYIPNTITPGPGCYKVDKPRFKKQKQIKQSLEEKQNSNINAFLEKLNGNTKSEPGPCSYNQEMPDFKPLYEKIKMSANFMAPFYKDRKKNKGNPSPTSYAVKRIYEDIEPKLICSTFFMSETKREVFAPKNVNQVVEINPQPLGHKNFHFNIKDQWIC